jgi:hypothetical protein
MKTKKKLQTNENIPKWIPPEKRMDIYNEEDPSKVRFPRFRIVVASEWDKKQLQAAFEYFHDNESNDTDFVPVNCLAHSYLDDERETGCIDTFIVDDDLYLRLQQQTCPHKKTFVQEGIEYCEECFKALKIINI